MNLEAFKQNTQFIVPYIIKNRKLLLFDELYKVTCENILDQYYIKIVYRVSNNSNYILKYSEYEKNIYNTTFSTVDNKLCIVSRYKVPKVIRLTVISILTLFNINIESSVLIKNIKYWKYYMSDIIEHYEKSLATQSSSQALFLFNSSCFFWIK